jgi:prevent-host-death family protein
MKNQRKIGLFEAKQKLSELVERASRGEQIAITRHGKPLAVIGPAQEKRLDAREVFDKIESIRKRSRKPSTVTTKQLTEEGRE